MELKPVVKITTAQTVVNQMIDMIRSGRWKVGDRLPSEKQLVEMLGVGRSTVREALQSLAAVNIVESSAGQRTLIKSPTPTEIFRSDLLGLLINTNTARELLEVRAMIEPDCARLAALRGTEAEFDEIAGLLERHERDYRTGAPVARYGAEFHVAIARTARNRVAESFMESILGMLVERGNRAGSLEGAYAREIAEHKVLFALIRSRQAVAAFQAMRDHIIDWAETYSGLEDGLDIAEWRARG